MPGDGGAVQLMFLDPSGSYTSMFIQMDTGAMPVLDPDFAYGRERCRVTGDELTVWRHDGFIYYLYTASPHAANALKAAFGVPSMSRAL
jgi:hypothetical protein